MWLVGIVVMNDEMTMMWLKNNKALPRRCIQRHKYCASSSILQLAVLKLSPAPLLSRNRNYTTAAKMSSAMPAQQHHSVACCNVPPAVVKDYEAKGSYETIDGLKTCTFIVGSLANTRRS
jgi:hypothetical protein